MEKELARGDKGDMFVTRSDDGTALEAPRKAFQIKTTRYGTPYFDLHGEGKRTLKDGTIEEGWFHDGELFGGQKFYSLLNEMVSRFCDDKRTPELVDLAASMAKMISEAEKERKCRFLDSAKPSTAYSKHLHLHEEDWLAYCPLDAAGSAARDFGEICVKFYCEFLGISMYDEFPVQAKETQTYRQIFDYLSKWTRTDVDAENKAKAAAKSDTWWVLRQLIAIGNKKSHFYDRVHKKRTAKLTPEDMRRAVGLMCELASDCMAKQKELDNNFYHHGQPATCNPRVLKADGKVKVSKPRKFTSNDMEQFETVQQLNVIRSQLARDIFDGCDRGDTC